jgi:biotin transport system substrate-specific component
MFIGEVVMYGVGVTWLAFDLHVGAINAISLGLIPFLAGDAIKAVLASLVLPTAWNSLAHAPGRASANSLSTVTDR